MHINTVYVGQPILSQVLSLIDEPLIIAACKKYQSDKLSKKLFFKNHLTTLLYCIFARCSSIREVQTGLEICNGKPNHINLKNVSPISTLSNGNKKRNSDVFER